VKEAQCEELKGFQFIWFSVSCTPICIAAESMGCSLKTGLLSALLPCKQAGFKWNNMYSPALLTPALED